MSWNRSLASSELAAALDAADAADAVIAPMFRSNVQVEIKADRTPVTEADRRAEAAIRAVLGARFPHYGFYGEEGGQQGMQSESVWLVDPLDGTKSFVRDTPVLFDPDRVDAIAASWCWVSLGARGYGELAWAEQGAGAWLDGEAIHVSRSIDDLTRCHPVDRQPEDPGRGQRWDAFGGLSGEVNRMRGYGDFVHYHLLARGALDVVVESDVNILDIAALAVIVREAGGVSPTLPALPSTSAPPACWPATARCIRPCWSASSSGAG